SCSLVHCPTLLFYLTLRPPPSPALSPYTTLFRSFEPRLITGDSTGRVPPSRKPAPAGVQNIVGTQEVDLENTPLGWVREGRDWRSEEHTSELQSRFDLVCRLLLEKKNYNMSILPY